MLSAKVIGEGARPTIGGEKRAGYAKILKQVHGCMGDNIATIYQTLWKGAGERQGRKSGAVHFLLSVLGIKPASSRKLDTTG